MRPHQFFCNCPPCWDKKQDANDRYDATPEGKEKIAKQRAINQEIQRARHFHWSLYIQSHGLYGPAAKFPA
jgi:hypothetical protein